LALNLTKAELEDLIKKTVNKELESQSSKKLFKGIVEDIIKDSDLLNEKEIRSLVRDMLVNMYKQLWQRQGSWKNAI
jgi:hypothetical protein